MSPFFKELVHNLSMVLSLALVYGVCAKRLYRLGPRGFQVSVGLLFGGIAAIGVWFHVDVTPGVIIDPRPVISGIAGAFFGPLTATLTALVVAAARFAVGGVGALVGVGLTLGGAAIGIAFYVHRNGNCTQWCWQPLCLLGGLQVLQTETFGLFLPPGHREAFLHTTLLPLSVLFPACSVLLGLLLSHTHQRLAAESQLDTSRRQLQDVLDSSHEIIYRLDQRGQITFVNQAVTRYGYHPEQLIGRSLLQCVHPADRKRLAARLRRILAGAEGEQALELRCLTSSGKVVHLSARAERVHPARPQPAAAPPPHPNRDRTDSDAIVLQGVAHEITAQKHAERENRRLLSIIRETPNLLAIASPEGQVVYMNPACRETLGWEEPTATTPPRSLPDAFPDHWRGRLYGEVLPRAREYGTWSGQATIGNADGQELPVFLLVMAHRDETGELEQYSAIMVNMAGKLEAERALRESQARYRNLFEMAGDAILVLRGGQVVDCNAKSLDMFGAQHPAELVGKPLARLDLAAALHEPPETTPAEPLAHPERGNQPRYFRWRCRRLDGSEFEADISSSRFPVGERNYLLAVLRDVTDQVHTYRRLQENQLKLAEALEASGAGILDVDLDAKSVRFDPRCRVILGLGPREDELPLQEYARRLVHPEDEPLRRQQLGEIAAGKREQIDCAYRVRGSAAEPWRWVRIHGKIAGRNSRGRPARLLGTLKDITEHRRLQEQLHQAQKMEAIGTLAGGIAHDFNNILSAVVGYAEMAREERPGSATYRDALDNVLAASRRAADLVEQILAFSRETRQEPRPVQTRVLAKESLKLLRATLPSTLSIRSDLSSHSVVLADPSQLHQVLMNLCTNASLAMAEGDGVLTLGLHDVTLDPTFCSAHPELTPGTYQRLTVSDTGCGIAPENLGRIFEPFFTTRGRDRGTGLGLSVVHGIVLGCHGCITADSNLGAGTTFCVYLPLAPAASTERTASVDRPIATGNERILVVDDEKLQTDMTRQRLERLGYRITTFTDSPSALQAFRAEPEAYDLVITDLTMPAMTGDVLARHLLLARPDLPIILCTGFANRLTEAKARALGIRELVKKPVLVAELADAVRRAVEVPPASDTPAPPPGSPALAQLGRGPEAHP